jgi:hypothetical protein
MHAAEILVHDLEVNVPDGVKLCEGVLSQFRNLHLTNNTDLNDLCRSRIHGACIPSSTSRIDCGLPHPSPQHPSLYPFNCELDIFGARLANASILCMVLVGNALPDSLGRKRYSSSTRRAFRQRYLPIALADEASHRILQCHI